VSSGAVPLPFEGDDGSNDPPAPPADAPCIYVASKITGTTPGSPERQIIEFGVTAIRDAVVEATANSTDPWHVRVHAPVEWTTPEQTPDLKPSEVFSTNARFVLAEADALVVYGWAPSAGVGQEITWAALAVALPVLYVEPPGHRASRQIAGTPGDVVVVGYADPVQLKDEIRRWIRQRRHQIESSGSRRRSREIRVGQLHTRLSHAWASIAQSERHRIAAHLGLAPKLIEWWLDDPAFLSVAPTAHLLLLTAELTGSTDLVVGRHELTLNELEALLTARDEHGWDDAVTEAVRRRGEMELAQPAVRRFRLDSPEDWTRLFEAMNR
jgi:hypothetical protein